MRREGPARRRRARRRRARRLAGCHGTPDGCAKFGGQTCISLELRAPSGHPLSVDQVELAAATGFQFAPDPFRSPSTPLASPESLPLVVPILPGAAFAGGPFSFTVRGLRGGNAVGAASVAGTVAAGAHLALSATLSSGGDVDMGAGDGGDDMMPDDGGTALAPRPLTPVSTGFVTTATPTFRWVLPPGVDGAEVEVCKDRACTMVAQTFTVDGDHGTPPSALPVQVLYWRLHPRAAGVTLAGSSPTWQFTVGVSTGAAVSTSYGNTLDLDGDGRAELAIGAPGAPMNAGAAGPGSVYVWRGDPLARTKLMTATPNFVLRDPDGAAGDKFGNTVVGVGDLDGDGFADLAVAAPCAPAAAGGVCGAGKVHLYRGGPNGLSAAMPPPDSTVPAPSGATSFAISVAGVDLDGDGYSDLVIGAPPKVYVYRGGPALLDMPVMPAWTLSGAAQFGNVVANGGDIDGDGIGDVVMSTNNVNNAAGGAYVYGGGAANGFTIGGTPVGLAIPAPSAAGTDGGFGFSIDGAHDINGDGYSDIVIGVPNQGGTSGDGALYVFFGTSAGPGMANPKLVQVAGGNGQEFFGDVGGRPRRHQRRRLCRHRRRRPQLLRPRHPDAERHRPRRRAHRHRAGGHRAHLLPRLQGRRRRQQPQVGRRSRRRRLRRHPRAGAALQRHRHAGVVLVSAGPRRRLLRRRQRPDDDGGERLRPRRRLRQLRLLTRRPARARAREHRAVLTRRDAEGALEDERHPRRRAEAATCRDRLDAEVGGGQERARLLDAHLLDELGRRRVEHLQAVAMQRAHRQAGAPRQPRHVERGAQVAAQPRHERAERIRGRRLGDERFAEL